MFLSETRAGRKVRIKSVLGNEKTRRFLFSLGLYEGELITLISILAGNYVLNIKDGRYAIDHKLAGCIELVD